MSASVYETGFVTAIEDGEAIVTLQPKDGHMGCDRCGLCRRQDGRMIARVPRGELRIGDRVSLRRSGPGIGQAIVFLLAVPLVALIAGGVGGHLLTSGSPWSGAIGALCAVVAAALAVIVLRLVSPQSASRVGGRLEVAEVWREGEGS